MKKIWKYSFFIMMMYDTTRYDLVILYLNCHETNYNSTTKTCRYSKKFVASTHYSRIYHQKTYVLHVFWTAHCAVQHPKYIARPTDRKSVVRGDYKINFPVD